MSWHRNAKQILISTARPQASIGKLDGTTELAGTRSEGRTPFASLLFTPLDDLPLKVSKHILITALARDKQTGARYSDDGTKLLSVGTVPLLLEPVQAAIPLAAAPPVSVRPLDHYGVPKKETVPVEPGGTFMIDGR